METSTGTTRPPRARIKVRSEQAADESVEDAAAGPDHRHAGLRVALHGAAAPGDAGQRGGDDVPVAERLAGRPDVDRRVEVDDDLAGAAGEHLLPAERDGGGAVRRGHLA